MTIHAPTIHHGDALEVLRGLPDASVDVVVTDPPYGLAFMGKRWDYDVPSVDLWREALRVAKPGAHVLAFAGSRTYHRMAIAIEDAGFEIRDQLMWIYGSGFSKAGLLKNKPGFCTCGEPTTEHDVRPVRDADLSSGQPPGESQGLRKPSRTLDDAPSGGRGACPRCGGVASEFGGFSVALKPAHEPIVLARKPFAGTVAANVVEHGTGALNVDAGRVGTGDNLNGGAHTGASSLKNRADASSYFTPPSAVDFNQPSGRWPANVAHDGSDEATRGMGDAARYFYSAKASRSERERGTEKLARGARGLSFKRCGKCGKQPVNVPGSACVCPDPEWVTATEDSPTGNTHPTVKPVDLMRWLCRLVTPPGGVVLDPFAGSGTTGVAAMREGFRSVLIEREANYVEIIRARVAAERDSVSLFGVDESPAIDEQPKLFS